MSEEEQNLIYDAFVKAGFEKEAMQLSITMDKKVVPGLGKYILLADILPIYENEDSLLKLISPEGQEECQDPCIMMIKARKNASNEILNYVCSLLKTEKDSEKLKNIVNLGYELLDMPRLRGDLTDKMSKLLESKLEVEQK